MQRVQLLENGGTRRAAMSQVPARQLPPPTIRSCKYWAPRYFARAMSRTILFLWLASFALFCDAQSPATSSPPDAVQQKLKSLEESLNFTKHDLTKAINDILWFQRLGDIATVDKVRFPGPPARVTNNPTAQNAGLELIIPAYTFIPRS